MMNGKPLCIDVYSGLGGWSDGFIAEGWEVIGFDIERHCYGDQKYPGQLVLQNALTIHGSQFRNAECLVMSPPCTEYSYMAMPWTRAKQIARALRGQGDFPEGYKGSRTRAELTALFDACFRIQREASAAAGRHIPMVVENVKGAQPWVGRAKWLYGSFALWGDVPALMPKPQRAAKVPGFRFDGSGKTFQTASVESVSPIHAFAKSIRDEIQATETGIHGDRPTRDDGTKLGSAGGRTDQTRMGSDWRMQAHRASVEGTKNDGGSWFAIGSPGQKVTGKNPVHEAQKTVAHVNRRDGHGHTRHLTNQAEHDAVRDGVKFSQSGDAWFDGTPRDKMLGHKGPAAFGSKSNARKAASAAIAKIPERLARWIARFYFPEPDDAD